LKKWTKEEPTTGDLVWTASAVNDPRHDGSTALRFALEKNHLAVVKVLLEAGGTLE